jgi:tetratricopeptide (TPR) repeat protein
MNCAYGLVFYPWKTFVPSGLSPIYLLDPQFNPTELKYIFYLVVAVAVTVIALLGWKRWPWFFSAWFCYAAIVSPVLGAAQSGEQIVADRYTYLSCLPFAVLTAAGVTWGLRHANTAKAALLLPFLLGGLLGILTRQQTQAWHDDLSLWNQALKADPQNWIALNGRGKYFLDKNELDKALHDFTLAVKLNPGRVAPWTNRGIVYQMQGKHEQALSDYNASLKLQANHNTYNNRGALKEIRGDLAGALADYSTAVQLDPKFHSARLNRGNLRERQGDLKGAIEDFSAMIRFVPDDPLGYAKRGRVRLAQADYKGAAADFSAALKLSSPDWPQRDSVQQSLTQALEQLRRDNSGGNGEDPAAR